MVQVALPLKNQRRLATSAAKQAQVVGLTCEEDTVTLQFLDDSSAWGQRVRRVQLDRRVAEELSRLLNYELEEEFKF